MSGSMNDKNKLSKALDRFILRVGHLFSWISIVLIGVILLQVVLRYVFGKGLVVLEELQWHLYAMVIMIGLSYGLVTDSHIRLDLLHQRFSRKNKELVEILGILFLLMPMIIIVMMHSWETVVDSWNIKERSDAPMGLCCRWFIKSFIPLGFGMLGLAAFSRLIQAVTILKQGKKGRVDGNK